MTSLIQLLGLRQDFLVRVGVVCRLLKVQISAEGFKLLNGYLFETIILQQLILQVIELSLLLLDHRLLAWRSVLLSALIIGVILAGGVRHSTVG